MSSKVVQVKYIILVSLLYRPDLCEEEVRRLISQIDLPHRGMAGGILSTHEIQQCIQVSDSQCLSCEITDQGASSVMLTWKHLK